MKFENFNIECKYCRSQDVEYEIIKNVDDADWNDCNTKAIVTCGSCGKTEDYYFNLEG